MTNVNITLEDYPYWSAENLDDIKNQMRDITSARRNDIAVFQNLTSVFIQGRSVGKIPTSSTDVTNGDKVGDFSYDSTYAYLLVDNAGTGEWRRIALGVW